MSKIPKFGFKTKPSQTTDDVSNLPNFSNTKRILRRSKSVEFLNNAVSKPILNPSFGNLGINNIDTKNVTKSVSKDIVRKQVGNARAEDRVPELPVINKRPLRTNLRRSKSFSALGSTNKTSAFNPLPKPPLKVGANKVPRMGVPRIGVLSENKTNTTARVGIKRPNESSATEVKNKVMKKTKVPDWDFKTRFKLLQEKHNELDKKYQISEKTLQEYRAGFQGEIAALQETRQNLKLEVERITELNEKLKTNNENLAIKYEESTAELENMKREFNLVQNEYHEVRRKLEQEVEKITEYYETLKTNNENLAIKYEESTAELENMKREFNLVQDKYELYCGKAQKLSEEKEQLLMEVYEGEKSRRKLHNCIQDLKGNIRVFCRLRPALTELEKINQCNFTFADENSIEIFRLRESIAPGGAVKSNESQEFTFDRAFDQNTNQEKIFDEISQLIQSAMDGYHVCIFAYGQTGSGKTYTMQGEPHPKECLGMIPRSVELIFKRIEEMQRLGWSYKIEVSFLEIYNENLRDLLNLNSGKSLEIKFNEGKGTTVPNLTVVSISTAEELLRYMYKAQQNRSTAVTNFNEHSSRSHAVTKIYIEARYPNSNDVYIGSVSLVDLAGSECAKSVSKERLLETKNINKSLSSLGNVMMALYKKETHIPYRNSKLTFLLQSSLGGNCKCLMIVNISPNNDSYNESINALRFAAKVKEVKIASCKNRLVTPNK